MIHLHDMSAKTITYGFSLHTAVKYWNESETTKSHLIKTQLRNSRVWKHWKLGKLIHLYITDDAKLWIAKLTPLSRTLLNQLHFHSVPTCTRPRRRRSTLSIYFWSTWECEWEQRTSEIGAKIAPATRELKIINRTFLGSLCAHLHLPAVTKNYTNDIYRENS